MQCPVRTNLNFASVRRNGFDKLYGSQGGGRHLLIVLAYDRSSIERCIHEYVAKCMGDTWHEIATKLARNFSWEFEDYRS